jgi:chromosomal replication initiator protein
MTISCPNPDVERIWAEAMEALTPLVNAQAMETWIRPLKLVSFDGQEATIECPNRFALDWVVAHHREKIAYALKQVVGFEPELHFTSANSIPEQPAKPHHPVTIAAPRRSSLSGEPLNPKYTFEEFVVGSNSQMTYAACCAVAEKPAAVYNPLFIFGGVGLGKTHLMQAIGHAVLERHPNLKVHYSSAETFMNELINAIRVGRSHEFREKYRSVDVLLIDDIQFLAGKESTQEEFFHTFNALHGSGRQIVVTSDRPPKEIPTLEERLVSRFEWGLVTDIQPPDYETRLAILRKKLEKENVDVPDSVLSFIASSVKNNIRELEGSLVKLIVHSSVHRTPVTEEVARQVLKDFIREKPNRVSISVIQKVVAQHFRVPVDAMKSKVRTANYVLPRQVAIFLARELTDASLTRIGLRFGGRDHTTVLHACNKIAEALERDVSLRARVDQIRRELP